MIILEGKNLCERQKELNLKVNKAALNKVDFQEIQTAKEYSDVDRLFKIDLASKYRNIDYLIDQLKCADSLYISRVLKCEWIYSKDYAHIINPDYLHQNIFPCMSIKMKKKTLSAIFLHVRDEARAQIFCEYCINKKMNSNAFKFLIFTSESYKQQFLNNIDLDGYPAENYRYQDLIGNSWILADIYGSKGIGNITILSYLYHVNDMEYLNLVEKYHNNENYYYYTDPTLSGNISQEILKKHKTKILKNPLTYLRILKRKELLKFSSSDDARVYAAALLPDNVSDFWSLDYYKRNKDIIDLIKTENLYIYLKQIFLNKYPKEEFEMAKGFYEKEYYKFMTVKERETWALVHLEKQTGVIPEDEDYQWYGFVNFALAFNEIKKKILITTNEDKRSRILITLVKSAKTQKEIEELLTYYYNRHVNEKKHLTEWFLSTVIERYSVSEFKEPCWCALNKLFHSLKIYSTDGSYKVIDFRTCSFIYHIINKQTLPSGFCDYLDEVCKDIAESASYSQHIKQLSKDNQKLVYEYVLQVLTEKIEGFESLDYNEEVGDNVRKYLETLIQLKKSFEEEGEYPDIALKYMNLDKRHFHYIVDPEPKLETPKEIKEITSGFIFRCLKQDPTIILDKFSLIPKMYEYPYFQKLPRMKKNWEKMKIYFSSDIAKKCLDLCLTLLLNISPERNDDNNAFRPGLIPDLVFAIFQLADEQTKAAFMDKHAPATSKIEHDKISNYLLDTQSAICRLHYYSRPPVPLAKTALYLKGDYVSRCKDMFNSYLVNLNPTVCSEFIYFLLDSPVSIQKRGLRLAFQSFEGSELKDLVSKIWKKTKNVSLRSSIYKLIIEKICNNREVQELELFDLLIELTAHIHQDDDESVFESFRRFCMPVYVTGLYLQTAWKTVSVFPDKKVNIKRKIMVVDDMKSCMPLMDQDFVETLVNDHISKKLSEQKLRAEVNTDICPLNEALWDLVATYVINVPTETKLERSLNVLKVIVKECFNHWNETHDTGDYVFQSFFNEFTSKLDNNADYYGSNWFPRVSRIFQYLLESLEEKFGIREMYSYYWDWNLSLLARTVTGGRDQYDKDVHVSFGSELGMFVKKLKERNCYYSSFGGKILGKISEFTRMLITLKECSLSEIDVKILIASGLARHATLETLVLALDILPQELATSGHSEPELRQLIQTIKHENNDELIALLNDKFIYTDFKVRKLVL